MVSKGNKLDMATIKMAFGVYILFALLLVHVSAGIFDDSLVLFPNDPVVCSTQNITFTCVNSDNLTTDVLVFAKKSRNEILTINGTKMNETAYQLTLYNISLIDHNSHIFCSQGDCNDTDIDCKFLGQIMSVYEMPVAVKNFQCVVYNWLENMNCSWDLAFNNSNSANVYLYWKIAGSKWMPCHPFTSTTYCFWNGTGTNGDFSMKTVNFSIEIVSQCGVKVHSNHSVNTWTVVKPGHVIDLHYEVENSTCITLLWQTTRNEYLKIHTVNYTSKWGDGKAIMMRDTQETRKLPKNITVCDLHPHTTYTFTVQIKPLHEGIWSDPVALSPWTYQDIPSASPDITDGGYMWNPNDCIQSKTLRCTCIYWKPIAEQSMNGILTGSLILFEATHSASSNVTVDANVTNTCYWLLCKEDYNVSVYACTLNGTSRRRSLMHILHAQTGLQPEFTVEMSNIRYNGYGRDVYLEWKHSQFKVKSYTVFWCKKEQGSCAVHHAIDWRAIEAHVNQTVLQNLSSPEDYVYGVSMDQDHGSSGLSWQSCIYTRNIAPRKTPMNVIVTAGLKDNCLEISWDKLTCTSGEAYIAMYRIQICKGQTVEPCQDEIMLEVDGDKKRLVCSLKAEHVYQVRICAVSKSGLMGDWSNPVTGKTVDNSLKGDAIAGIIVAGLFVLAFATAGHCIKTGKRRLKVSINMPFADIGTVKKAPMFDEIMPYLTRQDSQDSGVPEYFITPRPGQTYESLQVATNLKNGITILSNGYVQATFNNISEKT